MTVDLFADDIVLIVLANNTVDKDPARRSHHGAGKAGKMQFDLDGTYGKILQELQGESRPQLKLSNVAWNDLAALFRQFVREQNEENLLKVLCILNNCQRSSSILLFTEGLLDLLEEESFRKKRDLLIFSLAALGKHTVPLYQRNGDRLPSRLIVALRKLLVHPQPEVLEWSLRTIEEIGGQGMALKGDIEKVSFGFFYFTNPHLKSAKKIIAGLLKRWSSF